jgi:hypothetical protein
MQWHICTVLNNLKAAQEKKTAGCCSITTSVGAALPLLVPLVNLHSTFCQKTTQLCYGKLLQAIECTGFEKTVQEKT